MHVSWLLVVMLIRLVVSRSWCLESTAMASAFGCPLMFAMVLVSHSSTSVIPPEGHIRSVRRQMLDEECAPSLS